jgi:RNA polymerase sigma-70 factor (ECF subfamily)
MGPRALRKWTGVDAVAHCPALSFPDTPAARPAPLELEQVYRDHVSFVWRNARRLGCEDDWVDDAVHEVFLVVASKLESFTPEAHIRTWLFAITYRVVKRLRRNRSRYLRRLLRLADERAGIQQSEPYRQQEAGRELRRILGRLSESKRAVFILSELEGMTTPEIARCLGLRPGTVSSRLRAARLAIRARIERERRKERTGA